LLAKQLGYFDGVNPVQGTSVNSHAKDARETHAYSLEEINSLMSLFPEPASTAFAIAALAGLRRGEIEGLDWSDFHDGSLWVSRSIWNGQEQSTKTRKSKAPVPVVKRTPQIESAVGSDVQDEPGNTGLHEQPSQSRNAAGDQSLPALRST
jgi:integrase